MDWYESVVVAYLQAERTTFISTEYCIQLDEHAPLPGRHWHCDVLALECRSKTMFLCEVSYAKPPGPMLKRLQEWHNHWEELLLAVARDSCFKPAGDSWPVRPWLFIPSSYVPLVEWRLRAILTQKEAKFVPRITPLEMVQPSIYRQIRTGETSGGKAAVSTEYRA
jgi:hypothetical protein